jgi:hypothetical protein
MPATLKAVTKKSSVNKQSKRLNQSRNESGIKYSDKSPGQPQLFPIFEEIKKMLAPYKKGTIKLSGGFDGKVAACAKSLLKFLAGKEMNFGLLGHWYKKATSDSITCQCTPTLQ